MRRVKVSLPLDRAPLSSFPLLFVAFSLPFGKYHDSTLIFFFAGGQTQGIATQESDVYDVVQQVQLQHTHTHTYTHRDGTHTHYRHTNTSFTFVKNNTIYLSVRRSSLTFLTPVKVLKRQSKARIVKPQHECLPQDKGVCVCVCVCERERERERASERAREREREREREEQCYRGQE